MTDPADRPEDPAPPPGPAPDEGAAAPSDAPSGGDGGAAGRGESSLVPLGLLALVVLAAIGLSAWLGGGQGDGEASGGDAAALLRDGRRVASEQGMRAALPHFRRAYEAAPEDPETNVALGQALAMLDRYDEAVPLLRSALERAADPRAHHLLGKCLLAKRRLADARSHLERALELRPDDPSPRYDLAVIAMAGGDHEAVVAQLRPYLESGAFNPLAQRFYADALRAVGRPEASIAALRTLTRMVPGDMSARRKLQDRRVALEGYEAVVADAKRRADAAEAAAAGASGDGDGGEGTASAPDGADAGATAPAGDAEPEPAATADAEAAGAQAAGAAGPDGPAAAGAGERPDRAAVALYLYGRLLAWDPERRDAAREVLERAREADPDLGWPQLELAGEAIRARDLEAARRLLTEAEEALPGARTPGFRRALVAQLAGEPAEARERLRSFLDTPQGFVVRQRILRTFFDEGRLEKALEWARAQASEAPAGHPVHALEADALRALGRYEEAREVLRAVRDASTRPDQRVVWEMRLSRVAVESGDAAAAREAADRALELFGEGDPPADVLLWAGVARHLAGAPEEARPLWERGGDVGSEHGPEAFFTFACRRLLGREVGEVLERAAPTVDGEPRRDAAAYVEGLARERAGDLAGARAAYETAVERAVPGLFPGPPAEAALERLGD